VTLVLPALTFVALERFAAWLTGVAWLLPWLQFVLIVGYYVTVDQHYLCCFGTIFGLLLVGVLALAWL
jgi:hypothetical protein